MKEKIEMEFWTLIIGFLALFYLGFVIGAVSMGGGEGDEKSCEETVLSGDEFCSSIYGADYGFGSGIGHMSCFDNGSWHDFGAKDFALAVNSSYSIEKKVIR